MDIKRATERLTLLADGVEPLTDEVLENDHVCNKPEIIRALHTAVRAMEMRYIPEDSDRPRNASKSWSRSEDEKLCQMFDAGWSSRKICDALGRSSEGVAARLVRLGKISERKEFRQR